MPEITGVEVATQRASGGAEFTRRGPAAARLGGAFSTLG